MDFKGFQPFIDGLKHTRQEYFKQFQSQPDAFFLEEVQSDLLSYVKQNYPGVLKAYELEPWLSAWSKMGIDSQCNLRIGLYFMIMDYYHAKMVMPRKFKNLQSKSTSNFQAYLKKRTDEGIRIKTANQLKSVTISELMPDSWIGENNIAEKVKEAIQATSFYTKVQIDFDLEVPLSGRNWLKHTKVMQWEKLKKALDEGQPKIITYIISKGKYSYIDRTVIAYDYKIGKRKSIQISIYDLEDSTNSNRININLKENSKVSIGDISAFYIEEYVSYDIRDCLRGSWLNVIKSFSFWWYVRRIYTLLLHQMFFRSKIGN